MMRIAPPQQGHGDVLSGAAAAVSSGVSIGSGGATSSNRRINESLALRWPFARKP